MSSIYQPNDSTFVSRSGTFSGEVVSASRNMELPDVRASSVFFAPGSRTYWHRHEGGQILVVTAGAGILGTRDGALATISAGTVVISPPGEEHFHGATNESPLLHEAISFGSTEWLEEVTDPLGALPTT